MEPIILNLKIKTYKKPKMWRGLYFNKGWLKMYVQGLVAGRLKILDIDQPACYVSHFNVKEVFRNQGYGQQLFQAAVDICKQNGCTALSLHCSISNEEALRFYKRNNMFVAGTTSKAVYSHETGLIERNYYLTKQI